MPCNRPVWRWWLLCASLEVSRRTSWQWAVDLFSWCVLPEWLGYGTEFDGGEDGKEAPF